MSVKLHDKITLTKVEDNSFEEQKLESSSDHKSIMQSTPLSKQFLIKGNTELNQPESPGLNSIKLIRGSSENIPVNNMRRLTLGRRPSQLTIEEKLQFLKRKLQSKT